MLPEPPSKATSEEGRLLSAQLQAVSLLAVALLRGGICAPLCGSVPALSVAAFSQLILPFLHIWRHKTPSHLQYAERGDL